MTEQKTKDARGRKVGSTDTVNVPISFLIQNNFKLIPVRRKWVEQICAALNIEIPDMEEKVKITVPAPEVLETGESPDDPKVAVAFICEELD